MAFNPTGEQSGLSAEEEIRELERKLEERKRELALQGKEAKEEKEVFRGVLQQHIEEARPLEKPQQGLTPVSGVAHVLDDDLQKNADEVKKKEKREEQVRALVELALTRTIEDAVKVAQSASPYLLDELHDHLVDEYYDKLVQLRKVKPL